MLRFNRIDSAARATRFVTASKERAFVEEIVGPSWIAEQSWENRRSPSSHHFASFLVRRMEGSAPMPSRREAQSETTMGDLLQKSLQIGERKGRDDS
jgi:hypothetical protein